MALLLPFHQWTSGAGDHTPGAQWDVRLLEIGYVQLGERTLSRPDLLVLNEPWHSHTGWPRPESAGLVIHAAGSEGTLLFDWEVRRPVYRQAGVDEVWVIDIIGQRILRQHRDAAPTTIHYTDVQDSIEWQDSGDAEIVVPLALLFGESPGSRVGGRASPDGFATFQRNEIARLQRFDTPWTVGHRPQWFEVSIAQLVGRFMDEL